MESQPTFATTQPKQEKKPEKFDTVEQEVQWALDHPPTEDDKIKAQAEAFVYHNGAEAAQKFAAALSEAAANAPKPVAEESKSEHKTEAHHSSHTRA